MHLRALTEYKARVELLLGDPERAFAFKIAAAAELDRFAAMLPGKVEPKQLDEVRKRFIVGLDKETIQKEKTVIGDMRSVMEKFNPGSYASSSIVSRGVVYDELSTRVEFSAGDDR